MRKTNPIRKSANYLAAKEKYAKAKFRTEVAEELLNSFIDGDHLERGFGHARSYEMLRWIVKLSSEAMQHREYLEDRKAEDEIALINARYSRAETDKLKGSKKTVVSLAEPVLRMDKDTVEKIRSLFKDTYEKDGSRAAIVDHVKQHYSPSFTAEVVQEALDSMVFTFGGGWYLKEKEGAVVPPALAEKLHATFMASEIYGSAAQPAYEYVKAVVDKHFGGVVRRELEDEVFVSAFGIKAEVVGKVLEFADQYVRYAFGSIKIEMYRQLHSEAVKTLGNFDTERAIRHGAAKCQKLAKSRREKSHSPERFDELLGIGVQTDMLVIVMSTAAGTNPDIARLMRATAPKLYKVPVEELENQQLFMVAAEVARTSG